MYYGAARSRLWCAVVLGCTLVVWGILEAALVFTLRVRVLPSVLYQKEGNEEGLLFHIFTLLFCYVLTVAAGTGACIY